MKQECGLWRNSFYRIAFENFSSGIVFNYIFFSSGNLFQWELHEIHRKLIIPVQLMSLIFKVIV